MYALTSVYARYPNIRSNICACAENMQCGCCSRMTFEEAQQMPNETPQETHLMEEDAERTTTADSATYSLFTLTEQTEATPPLLVDMIINKVPLQMEVDTGASVSLISRDTYRKLWLNQERRPTRTSTHAHEHMWAWPTDFSKSNSSKRQYHRNDTVYAKGFSNRGPKWVCGKITKVHGKSIAVTLNSGETICRHIQHIRVCARDPSNTQRNHTCTLNTAVGSKSPTDRIT